MNLISNFSVRVKHDNGILRIKVSALSADSAKKMVCTMEKCPESSILSVRQLKS